MNKPRNPRYFPRMKVRGARRRLSAPALRIAGAFDQMGVSAAAAGAAFGAMAEVFRAWGESWDQRRNTAGIGEPSPQN